MKAEEKSVKYRKFRFLVESVVFMSLVIPLVTSITVEQLINSYDFDFNAGIINVTIFNDYMIDSDNNSINDTLLINLTLNVSSGTYYFVSDLDQFEICKNVDPEHLYYINFDSVYHFGNLVFKGLADKQVVRKVIESLLVDFDLSDIESGSFNVISENSSTCE